MPHGARSFADRDLSRIETRRAFYRTAQSFQSTRGTEKTDDRRHARSDVRHLPYEWSRGNERHARHDRAAFDVLVRRCDHQAAELYARSGQHERSLLEM